MKFLGTILLAGWMLAACSHSTKPAAVTFEPTANNTSSYLKPGERAPAGEPTLLWKPGKMVLKVTGNGALSTQVVEVNKVYQYMGKESYSEYVSVPYTAKYNTTCEVYRCDSGSVSREWTDAFIGTPSERIKKLDEMVKGLGPVTATALVERRIFKTAPKNWAEFKAGLLYAEQMGYVRNVEVTKILDTYYSENFQALGYKAGVCGTKVEACQKTRTEYRSELVTKYRDVPKEQLIETRKFNVNAVVKNALLQDSESDIVTIYVDENGAVTYDNDALYNRYVVSAGKIGERLELEVAATSRVKTKLSNNVVKQDEYKLISGIPTFILDIDSRYLPQGNDPDSKLVLTYEVLACEYGWTGTCGGSSWTTISRADKVITESRTLIKMDVPKKNKSAIRYTLTRKDSEFYLDEANSPRETWDLKTPKR